MDERDCPCEAWIPAAIMAGYACGNPKCRRTPEVQASFDAFVSDLKARRGDDAPARESAAPISDA